jgi:hypothetical protein
MGDGDGNCVPLKSARGWRRLTGAEETHELGVDVGLLELGCREQEWLAGRGTWR